MRHWAGPPRQVCRDQDVADRNSFSATCSWVTTHGWLRLTRGLATFIRSVTNVVLFVRS